MANEKIVNRENLKAFRKAFQDKLENGQIVPALAENLEAVSEESGNTQETPFILQGTGTANGTASVDTSPIGKQLEKQGTSRVVNQQFDYSSVQTTTNNDITYTNNNNGSFTLNGTASATSTFYLISGNNPIFPVGHKIIIFGQTNDTSCYIQGYGEGVGVFLDYNQILFEMPNTGTSFNCLRFRVDSGTQLTNKTITPKFIDLTQWFGSNSLIPQDLLDHPENAGRYGMLGLAYNTGTLENSTGRYLENGYRQIWDEQWEVGSIDGATGQNEYANNLIRSKNYIEVVPNTEYYFKAPSNFVYYFYDKDKNYLGGGDLRANQTFTIPSNAFYMRFRCLTGYGTTYNHDITISLYYPTGQDYDKYYAYVEPKVYDTGTEILRSAGDVFDSKVSSGEIIRRVGSVDLGALNWTKASGLIYSSSIGIKANNANVPNISTTYAAQPLISFNSFSNYPYPDGIAFRETGEVYIRDRNYLDLDVLISSLSGVYLYYELATPTTEQGTSFVENIEIDDYGTMGWKDTNNAYVSIPQGCKIFYPANYVDFIDSLGQREDIEWDATKVVSDIQLGVETTARTNQDTIIMNAVGGTLRQCLCAKESLDFDNTDFVDMGNLNWGYASGRLYSTSLVGVIKPVVSGNDVGHALCTKYGTKSYYSYNDKEMAIGDNGYIYIKESSYTDGDTFKADMKGVLLAYEKAS